MYRFGIVSFEKIGVENCNTIFMVSDKGAIIQDFKLEIESKVIKGYVVYSENHNVGQPKSINNFEFVPMPFYDHSRHMTLLQMLMEIILISIHAFTSIKRVFQQCKCYLFK